MANNSISKSLSKTGQQSASLSPAGYEPVTLSEEEQVTANQQLLDQLWAQGFRPTQQ